MSDPNPVSRRHFLQSSGALASAAALVVPATTEAAPATAAVGATTETGVAMSTNSATAPAFESHLPLRLRINAQDRAVYVESRTSLLDLLRERFDLTGTKKGCNEGACGACTVLLDGRRVNACLTLAASCDGAEVTTVEGLAAPDGTLHPVQAAFIEHDAFQCGYCTPGQVVSAVACIREGHATDEATVREWMSGNLCRCAAYPQITAAVLAAAGTGKR
jgi:xanthine dehydrogenase YagT iron-sulfur-binding subunit